MLNYEDMRKSLHVRNLHIKNAYQKLAHKKISMDIPWRNSLKPVLDSSGKKLRTGDWQTMPNSVGARRTEWCSAPCERDVWRAEQQIRPLKAWGWDWHFMGAWKRSGDSTISLISVSGALQSSGQEFSFYLTSVCPKDQPLLRNACIVMSLRFAIEILSCNIQTVVSTKTFQSGSHFPTPFLNTNLETLPAHLSIPRFACFLNKRDPPVQEGPRKNSEGLLLKTFTFLPPSFGSFLKCPLSMVTTEGSRGARNAFFRSHNVFRRRIWSNAFPGDGRKGLQGNTTKFLRKGELPKRRSGPSGLATSDFRVPATAFQGCIRQASKYSRYRFVKSAEY